MEALRGRKYQLITIAAIAAVVTAAAVGTLMGSNATLQGYVPQHERARAQDVQVNQGTAIDAESFASHLPVVSIDTHGQDVPGDVLYVEGEPVLRDDDRTVLTTAPDGSADITADFRLYDGAEGDAASLEDFGACTEPKRSEFSVLYPSDEELTQGRMDWIAQDMNALEKALYSYDYDTSDYGYWTSLDVDSFVDYFVFNEFTMNYDAGTYSTYVYKDLRGKLTIGPLWDFNSAYDNYVDRAYDDCEGFAMVDRYFYYMLSKDEKFVEAVIDRYHELRQDLLADEYVCAYIDETVSFLGDAADRNWEAWGYTFDPTQVRVGGKLAPDERNPATYDEAVEQVKTFVQARGAWLDAHIEDLRQFSHESAVKMNNH